MCISGIDVQLHSFLISALDGNEDHGTDNFKQNYAFIFLKFSQNQQAEFANYRPQLPQNDDANHDKNSDFLFT
jgi:hypothetical protein